MVIDDIVRGPTDKELLLSLMAGLCAADLEPNTISKDGRQSFMTFYFTHRGLECCAGILEGEHLRSNLFWACAFVADTRTYVHAHGDDVTTLLDNLADAIARVRAQASLLGLRSFL
jgi:hypothetical protein